MLPPRYEFVEFVDGHDTGVTAAIVRDALGGELRTIKIYEHDRPPIPRPLADWLARVAPADGDRVIELGVHAGRHYAVCATAGRPPTRRTLADLVRVEGPALPITQVLTLGSRLGEVIAGAHDAGFVHCDLRPSHVMIEETGKPSLALVDPDRRDAARELSLAYDAPEIILAGQVSATSDSWSLGIMLAELATGLHPLAGSDDAASTPVAERITELAFEAVTDDRLRHACEHLTLLDPEQRWSMEALRRWLGDIPRRVDRVRADPGSAARSRPLSALTGEPLPAPSVTAAAHAANLRQGYAERQRLLADALPVAEVADLLGVGRQTPHDRRSTGSMLAIKDRGQWRYPAWQFDPDGADGVIDGLPEVLRALTGARTEIARARWFTTPKPLLAGRTPVQALRDGDVDEVIAEARAVGAT